MERVRVNGAGNFSGNQFSGNHFLKVGGNFVYGRGDWRKMATNLGIYSSEHLGDKQYLASGYKREYICFTIYFSYFEFCTCNAI